ncbi:MAG: hypothetical protein ACK504_02810 [Bacteroidota bacterium]
MKTKIRYLFPLFFLLNVVMYSQQQVQIKSSACVGSTVTLTTNFSTSNSSCWAWKKSDDTNWKSNQKNPIVVITSSLTVFTYTVTEPNLTNQKYGEITVTSGNYELKVTAKNVCYPTDKDFKEPDFNFEVVGGGAKINNIVNIVFDPKKAPGLSSAPLPGFGGSQVREIKVKAKVCGSDIKDDHVNVIITDRSKTSQWTWALNTFENKKGIKDVVRVTKLIDKYGSKMTELLKKIQAGTSLKAAMDFNGIISWGDRCCQGEVLYSGFQNGNFSLVPEVKIEAKIPIPIFPAFSIVGALGAKASLVGTVGVNSECDEPDWCLNANFTIYGEIGLAPTIPPPLNKLVTECKAVIAGTLYTPTGRFCTSTGLNNVGKDFQGAIDFKAEFKCITGAKLKFQYAIFKSHDFSNI